MNFDPMPILTLEEEKEFDEKFGEPCHCGNDTCGNPERQELKLFIANLAHSREQKLIEKVVEVLEEMKEEAKYTLAEKIVKDGSKIPEWWKERVFGHNRALTQAIIKIKELK